MDIVTYVLAKKAAGTSAEALARIGVAEQKIDKLETTVEGLKNGIKYKGAVNYFKDLPSDLTAKQAGYCYTVKYKGNSGARLSGKEYVWGTYEGSLTWIELGGLLDDYVKAITYDATTNTLIITDQDNNTISFSAATHSEVENVANKVSDVEAKIQEGTTTENPLTNKEYVDTLVAENSHTHANKDLLDTYTQTEADLADAVAKRHSHENKEVLDTITAAQLDQINANKKSIADILNGASIDSFGDVETAVDALQAQLDAEAEIIAYQDQEALTAAQIEKARNGKLAIIHDNRIYTKSFQDSDTISFSHITVEKDETSSQNVGSSLINKEYKIILALETGMLTNSGYVATEAIGDYSENFLDSNTDPAEAGKKIIREQNLYKTNQAVIANIKEIAKTNQEVATKQAIIDESNKLNADYIDTYTTEDDIQSLFPKQIESVEAFETALSSADKYLELKTDVTKAKVFDIAGTQKVINLNGNTIQSTGADALRLSNGATVVIEGEGNIKSQEFGISAFSGSSVTVNGGTFTTVDNIVLGTNGTKGFGDNTITVNDGIFNAHITSKGYIACGVYVANSDTVILNGGTFNIYDGCGICVRSGQAVIGENVVFNMFTEHTPPLVSGKVGDSAIQVPTGAKIVLDFKAKYPGGKPSVILNNVLYNENNIEAAREAGITVLEA